MKRHDFKEELPPKGVVVLFYGRVVFQFPDEIHGGDQRTGYFLMRWILLDNQIVWHEATYGKRVYDVIEIYWWDFRCMSDE